jgi:hypothetical protein
MVHDDCMMTSAVERGRLHCSDAITFFFIFLLLDLLTLSIDHHAGCVLCAFTVFRPFFMTLDWKPASVLALYHQPIFKHHEFIQPLSHRMTLGPLLWVDCTVPYARAVMLGAFGAARARDTGG